MVRGAPIVLYGHDMLVQHIASRPGSKYPPGEILNNRDAFCISSDPNQECYNIVLDHVSGSWSTDEVLSTWADDNGVVRDVTISNSIFAEALTNAGHTDEATGEPEAHSTGVLIGRNSRRVSLLRNVLAYLNMPTLPGNEAFIQWKDGLVVNGEVGPASKDFAQNIMNNFIAWVKQTASK